MTPPSGSLTDAPNRLYEKVIGICAKGCVEGVHFEVAKEGDFEGELCP